MSLTLCSGNTPMLNNNETMFNKLYILYGTEFASATSYMACIRLMDVIYILDLYPRDYGCDPTTLHPLYT